MDKNTNKKHIDVVVKYFIPVIAGIETNVLETYSILAKKGWDITIHTSKDTHLEKNILSDSEEIRGLKVLRYSFTPFGFWPKIDWENTDLVCLHNFDIFPHFQILLKSLYLKIKGIKKYKIIVTPHGGFNPEWSVFPFIKRIIKKIYHRIIGSTLINLTADGVRAVSEWEKEEMIKSGVKSDLLAVISNGIEDEAYMDIDSLASQDIKDKVKRWGKYLVQIGRIYPIKNYETVLRAMYYLPKDINFVIAGPISDLEYKIKLDSLITELGLRNRVFFAGVVRGVDKYYMIKKAQLMVHMALWESFCNVVHEGLSQGLVCIVADNTALPYLVKDQINGYCIETRDYLALAKSILNVTTHANDDFILKMKERNKKYGLQYSWSDTAEKMSEWYQKMIVQVKNNNKIDSSSKKVSVTIGIPAHNEEKNIKNIIKSVLKQKGNFSIEKLIVICDGCTDKTESIVKKLSLSNPITKCLNDKKRVGKTARLNQLYSLVKSDYLLTLDADIIFDRAGVLEEIIKSSNDGGEFNVTTAYQIPAKPQNFVGKIIWANYLLWNKVISNLNDGNNIHSLHGAVVLLRRSFLETFRFPLGITCDEAYLYVVSSRQNSYKLARNASIIHQPVANFHDLRRLGSRIDGEREVLAKFFGKEVLDLFKVPLSIKIKSISQSFIRNPIYTLGAVLIVNPFVWLFPYEDKLNIQGMWEPVLSTKNVGASVRKNK